MVATMCTTQSPFVAALRVWTDVVPISDTYSEGANSDRGIALLLQLLIELPVELLELPLELLPVLLLTQGLSLPPIVLVRAASAEGKSQALWPDWLARGPWRRDVRSNAS